MDEKDLEVQEPAQDADDISIEDSILNSIKKLLNISDQDTNFDTDIIIHINSTFFTLRQLGVGPANGYKIKDAENKWNEFLTEADDLESVKTYIYLKVKLVFDPPLNGSLMQSFKETIRELEWRLNVSVETVEQEVE